MDKCKCGGAASLDWSGVSEYFGNTCQTLTISCEDCERDCSVTIDPDVDYEVSLIESSLINMWGTINGSQRFY